MWGERVCHPSADRLLYVVLHQLGLMGVKERRVLEELVRPGMRVVDVGANVGLYSQLFARLVGPEGSVDSFEPVAELADCVERGVGLNDLKNVTLHRVAAGEADGEIELVVDAFNSGNNRVGGGGRTVPVRRLDGVLAGAQVDFVKIDVQGWEAPALRGMAGLLRGTAKPMVWLEVDDASQRATGGSVAELVAWFGELGYEFQWLAPGDGKDLVSVSAVEIVERVGKGGYFDVLAVAGGK